MKIAIWHNLPSGGGKRAMYDHIKGLVSRGHHVEVWCPPTADTKYLPVSDLAPEHIVELHGPDGGSVRLSEHDQYAQVRGRIKAMNDHCRQCADDINRGGFDVLLANPCQFFRVTSVGKHVTIPKVVYVQEPYRWLYEAMPRFRWGALPAHPDHKPWWLAPNYTRWLISDWQELRGARLQVREEFECAAAYDKILVNSFFSRESVLRAYGLDSSVCYLGVDTDNFTTGEAPAGDYVVCVGAFTPEKRPEFMIKALSLIPFDSRPKLVWITNISSAYIETLKALATELGVDIDIKIRIDDTEVVSLLQQALAMVYAPRLEPFGYAPLEANACGTPVVAIAEGGVRETIRDGVNGLLCDPDSASMARAVESIVRDRGLRDRLGRSARRLVEETWTLSGSIDRLETALGGVV